MKNTDLLNMKTTDVLITVFTEHYKEDGVVYCGLELTTDEVNDIIFNTHLYYVNGERPVSYLVKG